MGIPTTHELLTSQTDVYPVPQHLDEGTNLMAVTKGSDGAAHVKPFVGADPVSDANPLPIEAAALPLPAGAATSALQGTTNTALGAPTDAEAAGDGSITAILKRARTLLGNIAALLPASLGRKAAASSLAVALSTEDLAAVGAPTAALRSDVTQIANAVSVLASTTWESAVVEAAGDRATLDLRLSAAVTTAAFVDILYVDATGLALGDPVRVGTFTETFRTTVMLAWPLYVVRVTNNHSSARNLTGWVGAWATAAEGAARRSGLVPDAPAVLTNATTWTSALRHSLTEVIQVTLNTPSANTTWALGVQHCDALGNVLSSETLYDAETTVRMARVALRTGFYKLTLAHTASSGRVVTSLSVAELASPARKHRQELFRRTVTVAAGATATNLEIFGDSAFSLDLSDGLLLGYGVNTADHGANGYLLSAIYGEDPAIYTSDWTKVIEVASGGKWEYAPEVVPRGPKLLGLTLHNRDTVGHTYTLLGYGNG